MRFYNPVIFRLFVNCVVPVSESPEKLPHGAFKRQFIQLGEIKRLLVLSALKCSSQFYWLVSLSNLHTRFLLPARF